MIISQPVFNPPHPPQNPAHKSQMTLEIMVSYCAEKRCHRYGVFTPFGIFLEFSPEFAAIASSGCQSNFLFFNRFPIILLRPVNALNR
jgi:hypothetical protein